MMIRGIDKNDIPEIYKLIIRNFDEILVKFHSQDVIDRLRMYNSTDMLLAQMEAKDIFVLCDGKEILATGALFNFGINCDNKYSLSNFFVKPEHHSRGIGTCLFSHILEFFRSKYGHKKLHAPSSRNAVQFYKRMGFTVDSHQVDLENEITWMTLSIT